MRDKQRFVYNDNWDPTEDTSALMSNSVKRIEPTLLFGKGSLGGVD